MRILSSTWTFRCFLGDFLGILRLNSLDSFRSLLILFVFNVLCLLCIYPVFTKEEPYGDDR